MTTFCKNEWCMHSADTDGFCENCKPMQTTMTKRFVRSKWHPVRVRMDDMQPGDTFVEKCEGNYTAAQQAAHSLRAAYLDERVWLVKKCGDNFTVERTK